MEFAVKQSNGRLKVEGALVLSTARQASQALRNAADAHELDLSAVKQVDSSALALVLAWLRAAGRNGRRPVIIGTPDVLIDIATTSNVDQLLVEFGDREQSARDEARD